VAGITVQDCLEVWLTHCVHLFEQRNSRLIVSCFQSWHAANDKLCDRLKHPGQSFRDALYVRVEWKIGAASHFRENPECALRGVQATLLKQEQSCSRRAQLLGGSDRGIEVAVKMVADDYDCLDWPVSRLLQGLLKDVADFDVATAHAASPSPVYGVGHVVGVCDPVRRNAGPSLKRTFTAEIGELDLDGSRREHFRLECFYLAPDKFIVGFGGQRQDHARIRMVIIHMSRSF
jgi:hypothetical protein